MARSREAEQCPTEAGQQVGFPTVHKRYQD